MGISTKEIKQSCKIPNNFQVQENHLSDEHIEKVKKFATTLRVLSEQEFEHISQHGYEVAQATLLCYCPDKFN